MNQPENCQKKKWHEHKGFAAYVVGSVLMSLILFLQGWYIQRENSDIKHRLDVKDAYFNKGLIDGAKDREKAYFAERTRNERILEHCKTKRCELPPELSVISAEIKFEPIENVLLRRE